MIFDIYVNHCVCISAGAVLTYISNSAYYFKNDHDVLEWHRDHKMSRCLGKTPWNVTTTYSKKNFCMNYEVIKKNIYIQVLQHPLVASIVIDFYISLTEPALYLVRDFVGFSTSDFKILVEQWKELWLLKLKNYKFEWLIAKTSGESLVYY